MKSLLYCRDPGKAGQNFIPAKRDHVITPLDHLFNCRHICATVCFTKRLAAGFF